MLIGIIIVAALVFLFTFGLFVEAYMSIKRLLLTNMKELFDIGSNSSDEVISDDY